MENANTNPISVQVRPGHENPIRPSGNDAVGNGGGILPQAENDAPHTAGKETRGTNGKSQTAEKRVESGNNAFKTAAVKKATESATEGAHPERGVNDPDPIEDEDDNDSEDDSTTKKQGRPSFLGKYGLKIAMQPENVEQWMNGEGRRELCDKVAKQYVDEVAPDAPEIEVQSSELAARRKELREGKKGQDEAPLVPEAAGSEDDFARVQKAKARREQGMKILADKIYRWYGRTYGRMRQSKINRTILQIMGHVTKLTKARPRRSLASNLYLKDHGDEVRNAFAELHGFQATENIGLYQGFKTTYFKNLPLKVQQKYEAMRDLEYESEMSSYSATSYEEDLDADHYAKAFMAHERIIGPVADALAHWFGMSVTLHLVGPTYSSEGKSDVVSVSSVPFSFSNTAKMWAEYDKKGYETMSNSMQRYGDLIFPKEQREARSKVKPDVSMLSGLLAMDDEQKADSDDDEEAPAEPNDHNESQKPVKKSSKSTNTKKTVKGASCAPKADVPAKQKRKTSGMGKGTEKDKGTEEVAGSEPKETGKRRKASSKAPSQSELDDFGLDNSFDDNGGSRDVAGDDQTTPRAHATSTASSGVPLLHPAPSVPVRPVFPPPIPEPHRFQSIRSTPPPCTPPPTSSGRPYQVPPAPLNRGIAQPGPAEFQQSELFHSLFSTQTAQTPRTKMLDDFARRHDALDPFSQGLGRQTGTISPLPVPYYQPSDFLDPSWGTSSQYSGNQPSYLAPQQPENQQPYPTQITPQTVYPTQIVPQQPVNQAAYLTQITPQSAYPTQITPQPPSYHQDQIPTPQPPATLQPQALYPNHSSVAPPQLSANQPQIQAPPIPPPSISPVQQGLIPPVDEETAASAIMKLVQSDPALLDTLMKEATKRAKKAVAVKNGKKQPKKAASKKTQPAESAVESVESADKRGLTDTEDEDQDEILHAGSSSRKRQRTDDEVAERKSTRQVKLTPAAKANQEEKERRAAAKKSQPRGKSRGSKA